MADQQLSNSSSAIARVSSNQPSYSYKSTAAVVGSCPTSIQALVKSFITFKESNLMPLVNLSALSAVASIYSSVQLRKVKIMNKRSAMSKRSRRINQAAARAARHRRQAKNGWAKSPAYQALCRVQRRFIPTLPTVVASTKQSTKTVINYSRLSDGDGVYGIAPAVRVHRTFASPVRKVRAVAPFEQPKLVGEAQKLAKALKQKRKEAARVKSLTHFLKPKSPELAKAKQRLAEAERKAARLSEEVRASSEKKGKSKAKTGVSAGVEIPETVDTFLEQLEALREAIDVNLYSKVAPSSHAQEAEATVADYKAAAEATGTADLEMSMGSKMPVTLEKVEGIEGMLLSINKDNKQAIHNHLKGVRTYKVSFHIPTCTIRGAAEYLLNIGFQVHPSTPELLWLAENTVVPALESPSNEKKEKREVKNKPSNGVTRLENFNENSQQLFVTDADRTSLHIVLAGKARGKHVLFNRAECTVEGAADYLLSLKFEVHPESDWLWLDKNLSVKPLNGEPRKKKEERKEKEEQPVTTATQKPECTALVNEDGLKHYSNFLINEAYDKVWGEVVNLLNNPATNKTSFQTNGYQYTCLGNYYWVYKGRGSSEYLTTQPDGTAIQAIPAFLKGIVENLVNVTFKGIFDGQFVAESCLVNVYQAGNALNYHVDKTEEVDAPIVSLSLGADGNFNIKNADGSVRQFTLNKGDLFMFYGKHRKCIHSYVGNIEEGIRINLTVRMVKKPTVQQEESTTVQQTFKRPVFDKSTVADKPVAERHISTAPQLSITEVVKIIEWVNGTFGKLYPVKGLTSLFTFEHTGMSDAEKAKKDEIAILASNIRMEDKVFAKCTMNVPSPCINSEFINYWTDDVHPIEKDNLLSGGTEPGNKLPYNSSPFNLCVAQYCVNGSTTQFTPAMYASREFKGEKATLATAGIQFIIDMFDAGYFTPKKAIPRDVVGCRQGIRAAVEAGRSIQLESFDSQGNETYATLTYNAEKGLAEILKDGKKQTLVTVASFKEDKVKCANEGGLQWRIYPYKVEVFLVEDREAILGSKNILNFCPYALLGVEAPKAQAAAAPKETKVTKPVTQVQAERTVEQPAEATEQATSSRRRPKPSEVEKAIVAANVNNELEALYKAVNLTFDTLGAPVEFDKAALRKKYRLCGEDEAAAQITLEYIFSRTKGNPVQYYSWTPEDVKGVLETLEAYWSKNNTVNGGVVTLSYHMTEEKELNINFGGVTAILISTDGRAYDQEGRSFEQAIEVSGYHKLSSKEVLVDDKLLPQEVKTPHVTLVKPASSTGKFMQAFCGFLLMLGNNKINVRDGLAANFPQLLREGDDMFPLTLSEVLGQNGGFLHGLQNNMKVLIHRPFNPNVEFTPEQTGKLAHSTAFLMRGEIEKDKSKKMWLAEGETEPRSVTADELKSLLKLKAKGQVVKTLKDSEGEVEQAAMLAAMPKYRSLGFHFSKGVFLAGITHVSLALAQEHAPNLFARMLLATGLKAEVAADYVVSLTLKASKGAKRATLSMAKAVHVVGEVEAGYKYYNQTKLLKGWLVQECMAPTFVMPPGMALFLGTEAEKPVGYFKKTERLVFADYTAGDNLPTAVTLKGQKTVEHCLDEYTEPIYNFDEIKGVHTLKFDEKPVVLFGTKLAWIPKEAGVWGSVEFTQHEKAELAEIRWSEVQTVGKATELAIEYDYYLTHRNPKLRGIIKAMMGQAKPEILYNAMNPDLQALGLGDIKLIAPQDTIKSDMLYSWLQVIGNTLRYSNPEAEAIKKLQEFKEQIHASLGLEAGLKYLVIEQHNVVAGLYQEMINYFEETFGRAIWMHVAQCGDQGTIMTELYLRKIAAQAGWVNVESSSGWGAKELALYYHLQAEGKEMGVIAESIDYAKDSKQNAIIFVTKDDQVVEYYQRSYCFIGAENAPVYGVELFESSTVAEAISDSRHMTSSIRSLSRMNSATLDAAKKLLDAGKEKMYMSLVIAGMASGDSFGCSKTIRFNSVKSKDAKSEIDSISLEAADIAYIKELLAANDLDVLYHEKELFKNVAHCFRDVVFELEGKKLWLPALLAIASLKSEDSSNNISQKFFRDILLPCLEGKNPVTLEGKRVKGILDSLCETENTKKLASAATNITAKRIALPHIPTEEILVLYSSAPNSICQKLKRSKFDIDKIMSGEVTVFTHNSRAPLTDGPILKLRIIKDEENEANFYQINSDSFALGAMSNAMDFGDYDGDGHYILQLEGKFEPTTFADNEAFVSNAMGFGMFNVYTNKADKKSGSRNKSYAADHYGIKRWAQIAVTLSGMQAAMKKEAVKTLAEYIDFNTKAREVQTKAVGIAYSIFMWSEHLVDILLAAQKLGIDIDGTGWGWSNAANADLVAPVSQMYEIILGGFSPEAWVVYESYLKGLKEGERTVGRPNLKQFNADLEAMGVAADKPEGFLKLMLAAHQLFFLEKHGKFCDHILSNGVPTKMAVPQNIKQMLAVALVSFELLRGKFAGFNGVLSDNKNPKATGHKVAMVMARTFLKENPEMIKESLVCYQLNQVIEECDWLLYGVEAEERSGRRAAGEVVPSKLQPHQLEYFRALAAKGIVEIEAETVDVEPVVETVEETVNWVEADIVVIEEEDAASTERFFLLDEEVWEHEGLRYGVYTFHNQKDQKDWTAFLNLEEEKPESIAYAKEFTNARLVKGRFVTPQRVVETPEIEAELPVEKEAQRAPVSFDSALEEAIATLEFDKEGFVTNWLDCALLLVEWSEANIVLKDSSYALENGRSLTVDSLPLNSGLYVFKAGDKYIVFDDITAPETDKADEEYIELINSWADGIGANVEALEKINRVWFIKGRIIHENKPTSELSQQLAVEELEALLPQELVDGALEFSGCQEEYEECLVLSLEEERALRDVQEKWMSLVEGLIYALAEQPVEALEQLIEDLKIDSDIFTDGSTLKEFQVEIANELADNAGFYASEETIVEFVKSKLESYSSPQEEERHLFEGELYTKEEIRESCEGDMNASHDITWVSCSAYFEYYSDLHSILYVDNVQREVKQAYSLEYIPYEDEHGCGVLKVLNASESDSTENTASIWCIIKEWLDRGIQFESLEFKEANLGSCMLDVPYIEQSVEPVEIESVVIEDEKEEAHSVLKQLVEVKENLPADKWVDVLSFVRGLVAEVKAEAVKPVVVEPAVVEPVVVEPAVVEPVVVEPAVVEPVVQEAPKQNPLIHSLVSVVNKKHSYDSPEEVRVDGDRESLLGNPFKHNYRDEPLRAISVAAYGNYYNLVVYQGVEPVEAAQTVLRGLDNNFHIAKVWKKPTRKNFLSAIAQLWDKVEEHGFVEVKCWCSPKQCHLDVVKADLEKAGSRAVWEASIYVAPVVVEEPITAAELTEAEENEREAMSATCVEFVDVPKPNRTATYSRGRQVATVEQPSVEKEPAAVPGLTEKEKQAPLAIAPDTQKDEEGGSPVVRRMPRPKSDGGGGTAATVDEQFVAKHPLDGLPAVPGAERNKIKDDAMAAIATQFIGFPAKPGVASSTENYRKAWGDKANTGVYTADDIIMVSGSGVFRGVTEADTTKVFNERYIPLVDKAIAASSKFVVGGCSGVDELLKSYVESKNYSAEWIACSYKGYWLLTPAAPKATGRARSVVELDSLDWLTPYIEKLETWTANEVTALVKGLNPKQQQALRLILLGGNYVLTGNAGTGKSHLSSVAVKILKLLGYWIVPVATTGLASMNLQDSQGTINRATGVGKGFDNGAREWSAARKMVGGVTSDKTKKRFSEVQKGRKYKGVLFLIDEVSMLDTCLGYVISEGLEINQRDEAAVNKARKTPIQWLCVGDFKQLEPVGGEMIMNRAVFNHKGEEVIEASLMEKLDMKLINLKQQMRQAEGSEFAQELNLLAIGGGHGTLRELENCPLIKGRLKASLDEMPEDALHVFAGNDELTEWNRQELAKLKAKGNKSKVYSANISVNDRSYTRASFVDYFKPLEEHLELAVGAPIRVKQEIKDPNNSNALPLAANGSRGVIVALNDDSVDVKLRNGNIIEIGRVDLHAPLDENHIPVGRFNQIPIVLAWATTFHGCQGMTEDTVVVHAYTRKRICPNDGQEVEVVLNGTEYGAKRPMFQNNAFYVGCSRVRELEDLYFYTGCDTVDLATETKEERNYRASTFIRLMFNSYKT